MSQSARWPNFRASFRFRLFCVFTLLTFLIFSFLCIIYIISEVRQTRHEIAQRLQLRVQYLAESVRLPLYAENRDKLHQLAEQSTRASEIHAVVISAPDGRILAEIRTTNSSSASAKVISQTVEVLSNPHTASVESSMLGHRDTPATLIGRVRMDRGTNDMSQSVNRMIMFSVSMATIFWLAVSLCCHLVLRRVTRSFNTLIQGIKTMQNGDFASRIEIESDDEPGQAARAVNNLADVLQQRSEENKNLLEDRLNLERQILQTQKLESLGIMAGGIAHDFNNLLQAILGNMELATMNLDHDSKTLKYVSNAMKCGRQAAHLTDLMLAYVGKGYSVRTCLNLNELVSENAEMLKAAATSAISMELNLPAELPAIMADQAQVQQVIMNLITNASESIEELPGFVRITTGIQECDQAFLTKSKLKEVTPSGRYVFLEVCDSGCGMSAEVIERLFDPFFTTKFTGRGLGMSAVLGIMKTHRGALFVESTPGRGSTIRVMFPIPESAQPVMIQESRAPQPQKPTLQDNTASGMALVVDDEKSVLKICTKMVKLCGLKVITACDGIDAVAKFREKADEIDVVLMDLTMPNMDGITAMGEIYSIRPDARVILSSGYNKEELSERVTAKAPSGFIRKPYNLSELEAEIRRVMLED